MRSALVSVDREAFLENASFINMFSENIVLCISDLKQILFYRRWELCLIDLKKNY